MTVMPGRCWMWRTPSSTAVATLSTVTVASFGLIETATVTVSGAAAVLLSGAAVVAGAFAAAPFVVSNQTNPPAANIKAIAPRPTKTARPELGAGAVRVVVLGLKLTGEFVSPSMIFG